MEIKGGLGASLVIVRLAVCPPNSTVTTTFHIETVKAKYGEIQAKGREENTAQILSQGDSGVERCKKKK
jgi:hypothetical protein